MTPRRPTPGEPGKGVGTWTFDGVDQALAASGASWYYNWKPTPDGISAPPGVSFVPMVWGASDVRAVALDEARSESRFLLGFNEPDISTQSGMTVRQALDLWPQLMNTGMELGSPAVAADAATPGGWLDQFMTGVRARGYRVDFITVHWYGADFSPAPAVEQLRHYLRAVHDRYRRPVWLTEFALTDYLSATPSYPAQAQQAAFLTAATRMLAGEPYVLRYAWFALTAETSTSTTGLFSSGAVATEVGRAFKASDQPEGHAEPLGLPAPPNGPGLPACPGMSPG